MLQSLLQPRYSNSPKMIGAMPAVAVHHERRRHEKRRRPSQLALQLGGTGSPPSPTPSESGYRFSLYHICNKAAILHVVVGSLLLGIVLLVVGLVQLSPGAEAAKHRYYLMSVGGLLLATGFVVAVTRCLCLHWYSRKMHPVSVETGEAPHAPPAKNGAEAQKTPSRGPLRSQASVTSPQQLNSAYASQT